MEIIPQEWSVGLVSPFLIGLSRQSLHVNRATKIKKNLVRAENIKVHETLSHETHFWETLDSNYNRYAFFFSGQKGIYLSYN